MPALAGAASRAFGLLVAAIGEVNAADHELAVGMSEQFSAELLHRFAP